ncbi:NAD(P)H-binding protein, partial [Staphylococcus epidermidis]|uniref:NAD(P)H-binding protein n=1 Tax=Staphylococcus epidermidis TaxID=1282 RepID=UPI0011A8CD44
ASTPPHKTIILHLHPPVKTIKPTKQPPIKHYLILSTYHSTPQPFHPTPHLKPYTIPNHYPDHYLTTSHLNYTILHPPSLTHHPATRKIQAHLYFD